MQNAAVVYRDSGNIYWPPIAEQRIEAMDAARAHMKRRATPLPSMGEQIQPLVASASFPQRSHARAAGALSAGSLS